MEAREYRTNAFIRYSEYAYNVQTSAHADGVIFNSTKIL